MLNCKLVKPQAECLNRIGRGYLLSSYRRRKLPNERLTQQLQLGDGESSCLAVALERQATIATDDRAARRYGEKANIAVTGTLGLLRALVRKQHLTMTEADTVLEAMIRQGYRSPVHRLSKLPD